MGGTMAVPPAASPLCQHNSGKQAQTSSVTVGCAAAVCCVRPTVFLIHCRTATPFFPNPHTPNV